MPSPSNATTASLLINAALKGDVDVLRKVLPTASHKDIGSCVVAAAYAQCPRSLEVIAPWIGPDNQQEANTALEMLAMLPDQTCAAHLYPVADLPRVIEGLWLCYVGKHQNSGFIAMIERLNTQQQRKVLAQCCGEGLSASPKKL